MMMATPSKGFDSEGICIQLSIHSYYVEDVGCKVRRMMGPRTTS